jgi:hypothetical protein
MIVRERPHAFEDLMKLKYDDWCYYLVDAPPGVVLAQISHSSPMLELTIAGKPAFIDDRSRRTVSIQVRHANGVAEWLNDVPVIRDDHSSSISTRPRMDA